MAPTRKPKSGIQRHSSINEVSPDKDAGNSNKSKPKVAAAVRNRSTEMVEALYSMNQAYLGLPEGTASVIGLIAMMTDHYSVLGGSDCERENNELSEIPQKAQKRKRGKFNLDSSKDVSQPQAIVSSEGCLSLLKKAGLNGIHPHAVRKRTPRVPVQYSYMRDDTESYIPPNKKVKKPEVDDDEHIAALTLTGALQRGGSPQVSQTPIKAKCRRSSPVQGYDGMQSEAIKAKLRDSSHECWMEGRPKGRKTLIETHAKDTDRLRDMEAVGSIQVHRNGQKFYRKKVKVDEIKKNLSDDGGEACSGTEEEIRGNALKVKVDMEIGSEELSPWSQRKSSNKKLVFGDESSPVDALLALANLSTSMLPTSVMESESPVKLKEDRMTVESDDKCRLPEAASVNHHGDKIKHLGSKEKVRNSTPGIDDSTLRKSKVGRYSAAEGNVCETKQQPEPTNSSWKRKRKSSSYKDMAEEEKKYLNKGKSGAQPSIRQRPWKGSLDKKQCEPGAQSSIWSRPWKGSLDKKIDSVVSASRVPEDMAEEENYLSKGKSAAPSSIQSRPWKDSLNRRQGKGSRGSKDNDDPKLAGIDSVVSTSQVPAANPVSLPTKHQNRRKMNLKRALISKDLNSSKCTSKNQPNKRCVTQDRPEEKLFTCLSSSLARRWCTFEWFYSAIDYAWFAKREFVQYLNHVGLSHIPRLTRVEWGVIRTSLGKVRRFSERFLSEERQKLKEYRESVRGHYTRLRSGTEEGLPTDLPRPLSVGQRVIAIHPKTREVHDGKVLTVDLDRYLTDIILQDVDCMPLNSLENMPEALKRQNLAFDKFSVTTKESQVNGQSGVGGSTVFTSKGCMENATSPVNMLANQIKVNEYCNISHDKAAIPNVISTREVAYDQHLSTARIQGREADIRVMSELNRALDRKEALVMELRNSNDILENQNGESLKDSEPLKKHIATAHTAILNLRQRNAYPAIPLSPLQKPPTNSNFFGCLTSSLDSSLVIPELGSAVDEIVTGSRLKAHDMVEAAMKAMSSMKDGEDAFIRIREALDSVDKQQFTSDIKMPVLKSTERENGSISYHNHSVTSTSKPAAPSDWTPNPNLQEASDKEEQIPSELITSCVATLLMIQTCTEQQYPPGDVAQMIDSAVTSLHPSCPQNLPIYREIQTCMGRIKTQILALIPT
ncbi:Always early, putative isoform 3 [Corchorus capsularis]|uniref:Always early, putative isoform 3 n=1 Tax=Corchorus capsularis TaxID=210143 RepID=A0A1R3HEV8_COCAP|nr:Always early, putative isoform 3 [Corchorus capsularis]